MKHADKTRAGPRAQQANDEAPRSAVQRSAAAGYQGSPRMVNQRRQLKGVFGTIAQLQAGPDEEPLQGRFEPVQRQNRTGLPDALKSGIESASGVAMDDVKVHYNSPQPAQLNAHAYAQGHDIHLAPGQERHLPHEAWHVVQQAQGRVQPTLQMNDGVAVNDDTALEREADVMGERALSGPVQLRTASDGEAAQPPPRGVVQRGGGDDFDDEGETYDDDVDPDLEEYLAPREKPTFGDFYAPALAKFQQEEQARRKLQQQQLRKQKTATRRDADAGEHGERRLLNADAGALLKTVHPLMGALSAQLTELEAAVFSFDLKKGKAGQHKHKIGKDAVTTWNTHVVKMAAISQGYRQCGPQVNALLDDVDTEIEVPTAELKLAIVSMQRFVGQAPAMLTTLKDLCGQAHAEIAWLDELLGPEAKKAAVVKEITCPNVYIHEIVFSCPYFKNIDFNEFNRGLAIGTHGKSADGKFVHKKLAGQCAITFCYLGGIAYLVDWGLKESGSQRYKYKRGNTDYVSNAGIGDRIAYSQL